MISPSWEIYDLKKTQPNTPTRSTIYSINMKSIKSHLSTETKSFHSTNYENKSMKLLKAPFKSLHTKSTSTAFPTISELPYSPSNA